MARELIVITKQTAGVRLSGQVLVSDTETELSALTDVLNARGALLLPLFKLEAPSPLTVTTQDDVASPPLPAPPMPDVEAALQPDPEVHSTPLATFFRVEAEDSALEPLAKELSQLDVIACAYVKPAAEPAIATALAGLTPSDLGAPASSPPTTPSFVARQTYLGPAPDGVDASYAWTQSGGHGKGIKILDVEGGWNLAHENLRLNKGGLVFGSMVGESPADQLSWRNHGTAVLGEMGGDQTGSGVAGICSEAWIACVSHSGGSANAIIIAASKLRPGDVLLLEMHRPGPAANFQNRDDQFGYIAVEWWPDDLAAIRFAVGRGVIVVEAAGNGQQSLDAPIYDDRPAGFPDSWKNPFNSINAGSGAVVVGAGAPPPGTHARNHGAARSRLDFSNYGSRVDCHGWGREVTTTGYGDLQGSSDLIENRWYTDMFSGTSSASPIVAGVVASVNGFLLARRTTGPLTPRLARLWLRATGSPQQDEADRPASQRIGTLPDLKAILTRI
jgi:hypothetical protein